MEKLAECCISPSRIGSTTGSKCLPTIHHAQPHTHECKHPNKLNLEEGPASTGCWLACS